MALPLPSRATHSSPISRLIEPFGSFIDTCPSPEPAVKAVRSPVTYRSSPDGTVTMGTDSLSGLVVLIVQKTEGRWDMALPGQVENNTQCQQQPSLEAAKQAANAAFAAFHARAGAS